VEDGERVFSRGWRDAGEGRHVAVLLVALAAEAPKPGELDRLDHEYGLKNELSIAWAAQSLEMVRERGRSLLARGPRRGAAEPPRTGDGGGKLFAPPHPVGVTIFKMDLAMGVTTRYNSGRAFVSEWNGRKARHGPSFAALRVMGSSILR
jgi:hypothetical protein